MSGHVQDLLSAYLDGELSPPERAMVEAHLAACDGCATRLEDFGVLDQALRELPIEAPAGYFEAFPGRVRERVRGRAEPVRWRLPVWSWAAAAALLLAVLTPLTLRRMHAPDGAFAPAPATVGEAPAAPPPPVAAGPEHEKKRARSEPAPAPAPERLRSSGYVDVGGRAEAPRGGDLPAEGPPAEPPAELTGELAKRERAAVASSAAPPADRRLDDEAGPAQPRQLEERRVGFGATEREGSSEALSAPELARGQAAAAQKAPPAPAAARPAGTEHDAHDPDRKETAGADSESGFAGPHATMAGGRARGNVKPSPQDDSAGVEFALLRARTAAGVSTLEAARALRDDWRSFAARNPAGARGDEARWQVIEAAWRAFRLGRDARDRVVLARDARTYVERADAAHAERVRAILTELERD